MERLHIGMQATAIIKALGAALDKKDIKIEDLIGKAPGEVKESTETIEEWKQQANERGLKTQNNCK